MAHGPLVSDSTGKPVTSAGSKIYRNCLNLRTTIVNKYRIYHMYSDRQA